MLCAGFNSYAASSPQDAAVHDVNTSHVGGNSDRDVYYDAVNMLSPWETLAAQDFWDNLETEASEDNPWDDAASSECPTITTCDSAMCLTCHMCSAPCACQVNTAALLLPNLPTAQLCWRIFNVSCAIYIHVFVVAAYSHRQ